MSSTDSQITRFVRIGFEIGPAELQDWAVSTEQATVDEIKKSASPGSSPGTILHKSEERSSRVLSAVKHSNPTSLSVFVVISKLGRVYLKRARKRYEKQCLQTK